MSLRQQIVRLSSQKPDLVRIPVPRMRDSAAWRVFCFGIKGKTVGTPPILRLLLQFDQVLTRELLRHHVSWLEESDDCDGGGRGSRVQGCAVCVAADGGRRGGVAHPFRHTLGQLRASRSWRGPYYDYNFRIQKKHL